VCSNNFSLRIVKGIAMQIRVLLGNFSQPSAGNRVDLTTPTTHNAGTTIWLRRLLPNMHGIAEQSEPIHGLSQNQIAPSPATVTGLGLTGHFG